MNPTTPPADAGMRIEPPMSEPVARAQVPDARDADAPPEDPPGVNVGFHGLRVTPHRFDQVSAEHAEALEQLQQHAACKQTQTDHETAAADLDLERDELARRAADLDQRADELDRRAEELRARWGIMPLRAERDGNRLLFSHLQTLAAG